MDLCNHPPLELPFSIIHLHKLEMYPPQNLEELQFTRGFGRPKDHVSTDRRWRAACLHRHAGSITQRHKGLKKEEEQLNINPKGGRDEGCREGVKSGVTTPRPLRPVSLQNRALKRHHAHPSFGHLCTSGGTSARSGLASLSLFEPPVFAA
ncbi:hypothetical protein TESG_08669 [Trichophyton tonsurans CBS 112818]|uniref:Uncharacterized protein n=1 Tax=Trichophyton tonsurans (strain CBS 112818) TaxID=647933 RepID=F2SB00_TRIT1|nr:hypothetical protein TESG_08669 [Trichophyton tonsurans CBS 112818]